MAEDGGIEEVKTVRKNKVLVLSTRGVTARYRHLMEDFVRLLPHGKKDSKMDTKERLSTANEICELRNCNWCVLFECRKRQDLYIWFASVPDGPSVKFIAANVHTMAELKFTGNSLLFSRALLSFDAKFNTTPHLRLLREIFQNVFAAPKGHRKTKPFVDHVLSFHVLDGRIWIRHYQIVEATQGLKASKARKSPESDLVEIGPRLVLNPVRIFSGSLCGSTIYENPNFVHPNTIRRMVRKRQGETQDHKLRTKAKKLKKAQDLKLERDPRDTIFSAEPQDDEEQEGDDDADDDSAGESA